MSNLIFDPEQHRYTVNGVAVPSVTTILGGVGIPDLRFVNKDVLEKACDFGTAAHLACELSDLGELDEGALDSNLKPMLNQWKVLRSMFVCAGVEEMVEARIYSAVYRFAGTLDRAYLNRKKKSLAIVDLKTGAHTPSAGPQTAAYAQLVSEDFGMKFRTVKRYTAHLLHGEEKGKLVEQGTHSELTLLRGKYYELVKNQLELGS